MSKHPSAGFTIKTQVIANPDYLKVHLGRPRVRQKSKQFQKNLHMSFVS